MPANFSPSSVSEEAVKKTLSKIRDTHLPQGRWLTKSNRYAENTAVKFHSDATASSPRVKPWDIAQYTAASCPLHCADGWSFLGRSLVCHSLGDSNRAKHFGYYAELRASMSLAALSGVAILNKRHCRIDCDPTKGIRSITAVDNVGLRQRTHRAAWVIFDEWVNSALSKDLLQEVVRPNGIPLSTWLQNLPTGHANPLRYVSKRWLGQWGLDIRLVGEKDRETRNEASYSPNRLNEREGLDVSIAIDFINDLWELAEPTSGFGLNLDRFLLRRLLDTYRRSGTSSFEADVKTMVENVGVASTRVGVDEWVDFLTRKKLPNDPLLLTQAGMRPQKNDPLLPIQVLSRAFLLLRIATGGCAKLLNDVGISGNATRFWWEKFAIESGLWPDSSPPTSFDDLWQDVSDAMSNTLSQKSSLSTYAHWRQNCANEMLTLSGAERIIFWHLQI